MEREEFDSALEGACWAYGSSYPVASVQAAPEEEPRPVHARLHRAHDRVVTPLSPGGALERSTRDNF